MDENKVREELLILGFPPQLLDFMEIVSTDIKNMKEQLQSQNEEIEDLKNEIRNM